MATQSFAEKIHYDARFLGEPFLMTDTMTLYSPFRIISWYRLYNPYVPDLLRGSMLWIFAGFLTMLGILMLFRPKAPMTSHGSARWAKYADLLKMDLISGSGVVVGLYDAEWKRKITKVLRSLELQKKEKESYAEMHYDRKRDNKMDKKAEVIESLSSIL